MASDAGVTLLLEGYVTRLHGDQASSKISAADLLRLYLSTGLEFLVRMRGSYTGCILDDRTQRAHLFNDRRASRPLFVRQDATGLRAGPEIASLARLSPALTDIDPVAVSQFVLFASYYNERTLFPSIRKLPLASVLTLTPDGQCDVKRYWQLQIEPDRPAIDEEEWIARIRAGLDDACASLQRVAARPTLLLSGGGDSRAILASLRRTGQAVHAVSYGTDEGDDAAIARHLAEVSGIPFTYFHIPMGNLEQHFRDAAILSDGQAETIDSPTMGSLYINLAARHDAFVHGDKSIYGKFPQSTEQALLAVGIFGLASASRFADMLDPSVRRTVSTSLDVELQAMRAAGHGLHPVDLRDKLYLEQRLANRQNGFVAFKLRYLEQFRPWLDEDLVDLLMRVPLSLRGDEKGLVKRVTATGAQDLVAIPYATKDSIPQSATYTAELARNPQLAHFIREQFLDEFDVRLASMFQPGVMQALVESFIASKSYPSPPASWWRAVPGMWRLGARRYAADRIHPVRIVLRLMQLNLFLASLAPTTDRQRFQTA